MNKLKLSIALSVLFLFSGNVFSQKTLNDAKKMTIGEQYSQAEELYKKLIAESPQNGDLYYFYGESELNAFFTDTISLSQSESFAKCKKIFQDGVEKDATNPLNYVGLARLEYNLGNKTGVDENIAKVNTMIPLMTVKVKKVENPSRYALVLNEMAKVYILANKTDSASALPLLRRAILVEPKNAQLYMTMGDVYLNLKVKDVNTAIANYTKAQELDIYSPMAKLRIGYLYMRAENPAVAIPYFESALKSDPNFAPGYKELGYVYSRTGNQEKSKSNYAKYLELSGNNIPAKISYAVALFKSGDFKGCISQINEIFAVDPSINSLNRVIAYSYFEDKQYQKALEYIEKYIQNTNGDVKKIKSKDYVYYGKTLGELGKADLAEEKLRMALSMDPTLTDLYTDIANYQVKAKNNKKAIKALEDKMAVKSMKIADYFSLGKYYYQDKEYGKSDSTFETLLNLNDPKIKPYELYSLSWQGYARMNLDTTFQSGYAKPVYEKLIIKAALDSVKYSKYLIDSYSYMGTFYFMNTTEKNYGISKKYYLKVLAIDPKNERALLALKMKEIANAKLED